MAVTITPLPNRSSSDHIAYTVTVSGKPITVDVTRSSSHVSQWLAATNYRHRYFVQRRYRNARLVVGMGVQWSSSAGPFAPAATLQLCVGGRCLIYQLHHADTDAPESLRRFLEDNKNTFAGIWNHSDRARLRRSRHELRVKRLLDLRFYVVAESEFGWRSLRFEPVETIVRNCLGLEGMGMEREICRSNWEARDLSLEQVKQACVDAFVSFEIGKNYRVGNLYGSDLRF